MKIKIINPDYGMTAAEMREREQILAKVSRPDTILSMACLTRHQVTIDSALDVVLAGPEIVQMAMAAERDGYDAVILYCLSDPALVACREAVDIPVMGGGQGAFLTAAALGYGFSLLTTSAGRLAEKRDFVYGTGVNPERLCSVRAIARPLLGLREDPSATIGALVEVGRQCVAEDGAQVLILGCLSFLGMADAVSTQVGVPVIDPAKAVVALTEAVVAQGLRVSRKAYAKPPQGVRSWPGGVVKID